MRHWQPSGTMGNICQSAMSRSSSKSLKMPYPKSLSDLLNSVSDINIEELDRTIELNPSLKDFRKYLRLRDLSDDEAILKFLLLTQVFVRNRSQLQQGNVDSKRRRALKKEQERVFRKAVNLFFSEDSEDQIPLSNQELRRQLEASTRDAVVTERHFMLLEKARNDASVTSEGLEATFLKYLKQTSPSHPAIACLLSIL